MKAEKEKSCLNCNWMRVKYKLMSPRRFCRHKLCRPNETTEPCDKWAKQSKTYSPQATISDYL